MKRLILFIHGLGGNRETWGEFPTLIKEDMALEGFDIEIYEYPTTLLNAKTIVSKFSQILSWLIPKPKLPKIQDIAKVLETDLRNIYYEYDEIYLITHSMGGLVARQYLNVVLDNNPNENRVKKLLMYAVPNSGSDLALIAKIYEHTQIEQLAKSSDFIEFLNQGDNISNLLKYVDTLYMVGIDDSIVDKQSASSFWGNNRCEFVHKGHIDMVKPQSSKDISYAIFRNFIIDQKLPTYNSPNSVINNFTKEVLDSEPFVDEVYKSLELTRIITLFSQDFTDISNQRAMIKEKIRTFFKENFYHLRIPQSTKDNSQYFKLLAEDCGFGNSIDTIDLWHREVSKKLYNESGKRFCFYITDIENGENELNLEFARAIRSLHLEFSNFFVVFIGGKKLASLVYGKNSKLSPLDIAQELFFNNSIETISYEDIRQEFENLKAKGENLCRFLDDDLEVSWVYYSSSILNTLFWRNIMINQNSIYAWRDKKTKEIAKEIFRC